MAFCRSLEIAVARVRTLATARLTLPCELGIFAGSLWFGAVFYAICEGAADARESGAKFSAPAALGSAQNLEWLPEMAGVKAVVLFGACAGLRAEVRLNAFFVSPPPHCDFSGKNIGEICLPKLGGSYENIGRNFPNGKIKKLMRAVETRGRALPKTKNPAGNAPRGRNQTAAHNAPQKKLGW